MKPFQGMTRENTALLVIDVINSCAHESCEIPEWNIHFTKIRTMVPNLIKFIKEFKEKIGGLVIYGKTVPWQKEYLAPNVNELYEQDQFSYYTKDISGKAEEFYEVKPSSDDLIFDKDTCDAFANPMLLKEIESKNIKYVLITGVFTDGCVLASTLGGFSRRLNMIVLKDLCETTDSPTRQLIQQKLFEFTFPYMFARVTTSNELLKSF